MTSLAPQARVDLRVDLHESLDDLVGYLMQQVTILAELSRVANRLSEESLDLLLDLRGRTC
jgi:hypothetical protein